jgi:hypothetical protein
VQQVLSTSGCMTILKHYRHTFAINTGNKDFLWCKNTRKMPQS